jgi:CheY-like chemotaxis protein
MLEEHLKGAGRSGRSGALIVLVEDNDDVREVTAMLLSKLDYVVVEAQNGASALRLLESGAGADLLMVDLGLPDMSGTELAAQARGRWPSLKVLFITGYSDLPAAHGQLLVDEQIVRKPFTFRQIDAAIAAALSRPPGHDGAVKATA